MPPSDVRRFSEIASLESADALPWWELHIFPREAASAIDDGLNPEDAFARIKARRDSKNASWRKDEARKAEEARTRAREQRRRFEQDDGVVLLLSVDSDESTHRLRSVTDEGWCIERFGGEAHPVIVESRDPVSALDLFADHLRSESSEIAWAQSMGAPRPSALRLVQSLRTVLADGFRLDRRGLSVATGVSLRRLLVPTDPEEWPDHREGDGVVVAVADLYLVRSADGSLLPIGFFETDEAARAHPAWPIGE